jgi:hypothetical protein
VALADRAACAGHRPDKQGGDCWCLVSVSAVPSSDPSIEISGSGPGAEPTPGDAEDSLAPSSSRGTVTPAAGRRVDDETRPHTSESETDHRGAHHRRSD